MKMCLWEYWKDLKFILIFEEKRRVIFFCETFWTNFFSGEIVENFDHFMFEIIRLFSMKKVVNKEWLKNGAGKLYTKKFRKICLLYEQTSLFWKIRFNLYIYWDTCYTNCHSSIASPLFWSTTNNKFSFQCISNNVYIQVTKKTEPVSAIMFINK